MKPDFLSQFDELARIYTELYIKEKEAEHFDTAGILLTMVTFAATIKDLYIRISDIENKLEETKNG